MKGSVIMAGNIISLGDQGNFLAVSDYENVGFVSNFFSDIDGSLDQGDPVQLFYQLIRDFCIFLYGRNDYAEILMYLHAVF